MKHRIFYCLFFFISFITFVQNSACACCSPQHSQFDFWVGDWEVFNKKGEKIGENLVKKLEDNCIINENWKGKNGSSGKSYNYYDPADETWNQLWISNSGNILKLKGKAQADKMILKSGRTTNDNRELYNQITWTKKLNGDVIQLWEIFDLQGNLINTTFEGIYKKKAN